MMIPLRSLFCLLAALANLAVPSLGPAQTSEPAKSSLQEIEGLKLNCPVPLLQKPDKGVPGAEEVIVRSLTFGTKTEETEINVNSVEFKSADLMNLKGAAPGAAAGISKLDGISNPKFTLTDLKMPGADGAVRMSYTATRSGKQLRIEALFIQKGAHMWTVMAGFDGAMKRSVFIGETVIKSVRLQ